METPEEKIIKEKIIHAKSAVHLLVSNVPSASPHQTIAAVEDMILNNVKQYYSISYIYVINHLNHLVGVLSIKDVYRLPKSKILQDVMVTPVISVHPHTHRQTVCNLALRHKIKSVPVIDHTTGKFLGVIPSDVILKVAYDELTEDIFLGEGIQAKEYKSIATMTNTPLSLLGKRLPWLLAGLGGGLIAAYIVHHFEGLLAKEVLIIGFMPLIVYISDAVGSQSQTIFIRSLAIDRINIFKYLKKELKVGTLIALSLMFIIIALLGLFGKLFFGIVLGISLFFTIVISIVAAILIPWIIVKNKRDPAIGSGPFATILRDIASIAVYFYISHLLFSAL